MTEPDPKPIDTPPEPDPKGGDDLAAVRKEAAKYRTRAKDAEGERDSLAEQLTTLRRAEAERVASTAADDFRPLADGSDLWRGDVELDALVGEDGTVDPAAVREQAAKVAEGRPHYLAPGKSASGDADQGKGAPPNPDDKPSFGEALKQA